MEIIDNKALLSNIFLRNDMVVLFWQYTLSSIWLKGRRRVADCLLALSSCVGSKLN